MPTNLRVEISVEHDERKRKNEGRVIITKGRRSHSVVTSGKSCGNVLNLLCLREISFDLHYFLNHANLAGQTESRQKLPQALVKWLLIDAHNMGDVGLKRLHGQGAIELAKELSDHDPTETWLFLQMMK